MGVIRPTQKRELATPISAGRQQGVLETVEMGVAIPRIVGEFPRTDSAL